MTLVLAVLWLAVAAGATLMGLQYYLLPMNERAFSPLADLFAPTGLWGQGFGVVGTLLLVLGVAGYMARKRLPFMQRLGPLKHWLQVHIFLCTLGPYLVLLHTTFKFGGVVSIAFWSMAVVVVSGIFGRYVYARIPKTVQGRFLGMDALRLRVAELADQVRERTDLAADELTAILKPPVALPARPPGLAGALVMAMRSDLSRRREERLIRQVLAARAVPRGVREDVLRLTREQHRLRQQAMVLHPFQRLFRYWHVIHLPLAMVMAIILVLHVGVAVAFGYTWIW